MVNFTGRAARASAGDIAGAAARIGLDSAHLLAVLVVETTACGFDTHNRPKILFEPRVFQRLLGALGSPGFEKARRAIQRGLASSDGTRIPYSLDSYPTLARAVAIDEDLALCATSWGIGQVMGEHHALLGYPTVQAMVQAACDSEGRQVEMVAAYLKHFRLDAALRDEDWLGFARGYNGPGNVVSYAARLEDAFSRLRRVSLTPTPALEATADDLNAQELARLAITTVV